MTQSNASQKLYISMPTNSKCLKSMPSFIPQQLPSSNWHSEKAHKEKGRGLCPLSWSTPSVPCFCPWTFPVKSFRDLQSRCLFTLCLAETLVCQRPQCLYDLGVSPVSNLDSNLRSSSLGSGVTVKSESESCSVVSNSLWPCRLCSPWNSPGQNTGVGGVSPSSGDLPNPGIESRSPALQMASLSAEPPGKPKSTRVGSLSLLQWIFLTQESNRGLLHCRQIFRCWLRCCDPDWRSKYQQKMLWDLHHPCSCPFHGYSHGEDEASRKLWNFALKLIATYMPSFRLPRWW